MMNGLEVILAFGFRRELNEKNPAGKICLPMKEVGILPP